MQGQTKNCGVALHGGCAVLAAFVLASVPEVLLQPSTISASPWPMLSLAGLLAGSRPM